MLVALISFVSFALTIVYAFRVRGQRAPQHVPGLAGAGLFMLLQLLMGELSLAGMVADDAVAALVLNAVLAACAVTTLHRDRIRGGLQGRMGRLRIAALRRPLVKSAAAILLAALAATLALEIPSNHDIFGMYPLCFLLEWMILGLLMLGLFFIFQRRGVVPAIVAIFFHGVGLAQFFVITFKSMPIGPADISALSTAAAVAGSGYAYVLSAYCLYGMAFMAVSVLLCQLAGAVRTLEAEGADEDPVAPGAATDAVAPEADVPVRRSPRRLLAVNLAVGAALLGCLMAHVTLIDYYNTLSIQIYTWRPLNSYYTQGFLPCFISGAQTIKPPRPDDYSIEDAEELLNKSAAAYDQAAGSSKERKRATEQFQDQKPAVVAIMNETFADLSIYQNLHAGYKGPQFFKGLSDTLQRGKLYVSAYGGGTCNTEFEFLTGNSMAFLGSGVYPYTIYDLTRTESLSAQFKDMGYATTAIHPNHATNWNRENVYQDFGFDEFLTIEDFEGADRLRGMVTDKETYDVILDKLRGDQGPQFIFDVTMQNHSGYKTGLIPASKQVDYRIDGEVDSEANEYLALIEESDRALEYFVNELRELDRPVVLVFFGDHQPFFPDAYNEAWFTDEDEATHAERLWQTDYFIWANYDVAGNAQESAVDDLSTNYLGSEMMELIGAPMSDYQKARTSLREALPAINATGFEDGSGRWHLSSAAADGAAAESGGAGAQALAARDELARLQYLSLFRDGKDIYTKTRQSAANETDPNAAPAGQQ